MKWREAEEAKRYGWGEKVRGGRGEGMRRGEG